MCVPDRLTPAISDPFQPYMRLLDLEVEVEALAFRGVLNHFVNPRFGLHNNMIWLSAVFQR